MRTVLAQFDVFVNPAPKARRAYPFVLSLQANLALTTDTQIVAPLVPRLSVDAVFGRLTPVVKFEDAEFVAMIHSLGRVRSRDLVQKRDSLASARGDLLAAIDYLFFGI